MRRILPLPARTELGRLHARAAGFTKRVTPHTMRHSGATELSRLSVDMRVINRAWRHKSTNTTKRYVHLVDPQVHAALARLGGVAAARWSVDPSTSAAAPESRSPSSP